MAHFTIREGQTLPTTATSLANTNGFTIDGGQGLALIGGIETDLDILFSGGNEVVVPRTTTVVPMGNAYVIVEDTNPTAGTTFVGEETTHPVVAATQVIQGGKGTAYIKRTATSPEIKVGLAELEHGFGLSIGSTIRTATNSFVVLGVATPPAGQSTTYTIFDKESISTITSDDEVQFVGGKGIVEVTQVDSAGDVLDTYRIRLRDKNEFNISNTFNGTGTATSTTVTPLGNSFLVSSLTA